MAKHVCGTLKNFTKLNPINAKKNIFINLYERINFQRKSDKKDFT